MRDSRGPQASDARSRRSRERAAVKSQVLRLYRASLRRCERVGTLRAHAEPERGIAAGSVSPRPNSDRASRRADHCRLYARQGEPAHPDPGPAVAHAATARARSGSTPAPPVGERSMTTVDAGWRRRRAPGAADRGAKRWPRCAPYLNCVRPGSLGAAKDPRRPRLPPSGRSTRTLCTATSTPRSHRRVRLAAADPGRRARRAGRRPVAVDDEGPCRAGPAAGRDDP